MENYQIEQFKAPNFSYNSSYYKVFLAGTIGMGQAPNWQQQAYDMFVTKMADKQGHRSYKIAVLNPRRDDWDSNWEQVISNPAFFQQVTWELDGLKKSDHILFYFDVDSDSPITLMELGLCSNFTNEKDIIVVCPPGFYRKGNVEVLCSRVGIPMYNTLEEGIDALINIY